MRFFGQKKTKEKAVNLKPFGLLWPPEACGLFAAIDAGVAIAWVPLRQSVVEAEFVGVL